MGITLKEDDYETEEEEVIDQTTTSPKTDFPKESPKGPKQKRAKYETRQRNRNSKREREEPSNSFMEEMRREFRLMHSKFNTNVRKIDKVNNKIEKLEKQSAKREKDNKKEFDSLRREFHKSTAVIEDNVKKSVLESLKPNITLFRQEVKADLNKIVQNKVDEALKPLILENNKLKEKKEEEATPQDKEKQPNIEDVGTNLTE